MAKITSPGCLLVFRFHRLAGGGGLFGNKPDKTRPRARKRTHVRDRELLDDVIGAPLVLGDLHGDVPVLPAALVHGRPVFCTLVLGFKNHEGAPFFIQTNFSLNIL